MIFIDGKINFINSTPIPLKKIFWNIQRPEEHFLNMLRLCFLNSSQYNVQRSRPTYGPIQVKAGTKTPAPTGHTWHCSLCSR